SSKRRTRRPRWSSSHVRSSAIAASSCITCSTTSSAIRRAGRLQPTGDARRVDVRGGANLKHAARLALAFELLHWIGQRTRRGEEVEADVVLECRERADIPAVLRVDRNAPLDHRRRVGRAFLDQPADLDQQGALVGRLLREVALDGRASAIGLACFLWHGLLRRALLGTRLGGGPVQLPYFATRIVRSCDSAPEELRPP